MAVVNIRVMHSSCRDCASMPQRMSSRPLPTSRRSLSVLGVSFGPRRTLKAHGLGSLRNGQFIVISNPEDIAAGHCSDFFKHNICELI